MTPALGVDETIDGLREAVVADIPVGEQYSTELSQRLPYHRLGTRGGEGKGHFILIAINGPEVAGMEFAFAVAPGFDRRLIHRQHLTLQNRGEQRLIDGV